MCIHNSRQHQPNYFTGSAIYAQLIHLKIPRFLFADSEALHEYQSHNQNI